MSCDAIPQSLQLPIQLAAQRIGLQRAIGAIMVGWGLVALSFAGLTSNPWHLYTLRFLLGAMEVRIRDHISCHMHELSACASR